MSSKTENKVNFSHSITFIMIHTKLLILTEFPFGKGSEIVFIIQKCVFT